MVSLIVIQSGTVTYIQYKNIVCVGEQYTQKGISHKASSLDPPVETRGE